MEEEDNIIVKWAQEDVETSYNLLNKYLLNGTIFGGVGDIENKIYVLIFYTNFVWNISHYKKNSLSYYHKCT